MKYNVGDKVRVRTNLLCWGTREMLHGEVVSIKNVRFPYYWLEGLTYPLTADEFEPIETNSPNGERYESNDVAQNGIIGSNQYKEDKQMKFTFNTTEGIRYVSHGKHNGETIPTITTTVNVGEHITGSATCDKTEYDEREGILNAIANAVCGGNFDREYKKIVKQRKVNDKVSRTCSYCGQPFETIKEKEQHEKWHIVCRKAKHERYLIRKEAKRRLAEDEYEFAVQEEMRKISEKENGCNA